MTSETDTCKQQTHKVDTISIQEQKRIIKQKKAASPGPGTCQDSRVVRLQKIKSFVVAILLELEIPAVVSEMAERVVGYSDYYPFRRRCFQFLLPQCVLLVTYKEQQLYSRHLFRVSGFLLGDQFWS